MWELPSMILLTTGTSPGATASVKMKIGGKVKREHPVHWRLP